MQMHIFQVRATVLLGTVCTSFLGTSLIAAPALKDEAKSDSVADLSSLHEIIAAAAQDGKWPAAANEKKTRDAIRTLFSRVLKAVDAKDRKLPVEFDEVEKAEVARSFEKVQVKKTFVLAGDVQGTVASDSIIFASGDVKFTGATNCIIVGKNVRFTSATNCLVIAAEYVRGTVADVRKDDKTSSVIVSGKWIRLNTMAEGICHILRPGTDSPPDDPKGLAAPPIRMTVARNSVFLNRPEDIQTTTRTDCRCVELKDALAK